MSTCTLITILVLPHHFHINSNLDSCHTGMFTIVKCLGIFSFNNSYCFYCKIKSSLNATEAVKAFNFVTLSLQWIFFYTSDTYYSKSKTDTNFWDFQSFGFHIIVPGASLEISHVMFLSPSLQGIINHLFYIFFNYFHKHL